MSAEEATHAANDGLEDLYLAVEVEATGAQAVAGRARAAVTVLLDESANAVLEVSQGTGARVGVRGEQGQRGQAVDQSKGVVSESVVELVA
jgi:hypothetical protein